MMRQVEECFRPYIRKALLEAIEHREQANDMVAQNQLECKNATAELRQDAKTILRSLLSLLELFVPVGELIGPWL